MGTPHCNGGAEHPRAACRRVPYGPASDVASYEELFRSADDALLRAKREGRNRVVAASGPLHVVAA